MTGERVLILNPRAGAVSDETMADHRPEPGSLGLLLALGPGFCSELVLLEW